MVTNRLMSSPCRQIEKPAAKHLLAPNLVDYDQARATFSWSEARQQLTGLPNGAGLNIAYEAVDRHIDGPRAKKTAIRWLGKHGKTIDYTFAQLHEQTNRFANTLRQLGVGKGDRVYVLAGRVPELYIAALGTLKNGSVFSPLFSAFGPEPIHARMSIGSARVLVTTVPLYERKVSALRAKLPHLEHVILIGSDAAPTAVANTRDFWILLAAADARFTFAPTSPDDISRAVVRRPGSQVSLITYGGTLGKTMQAAEALAGTGIDAEVIDLRVLRPLDTPAVIQSVSRTHRAVIIDEGWRSGGIAAEIIARINEQAFYELDAPPARVCSAEVPMPYAKHLEDAALPQVREIIGVARRLVTGRASKGG